MYDAVTFLHDLFAPSDIGPDDLPGDWRCEWEEMSATLEYVNNLPRERAEARALTDILHQMREQQSR